MFDEIVPPLQILQECVEECENQLARNKQEIDECDREMKKLREEKIEIEENFLLYKEAMKTLQKNKKKDK